MSGHLYCQSTRAYHGKVRLRQFARRGPLSTVMHLASENREVIEVEVLNIGGTQTKVRLNL